LVTYNNKTNPQLPTRKSGQTGSFWMHLRFSIRRNPMGVVGFIFILSIIVMAIFADQLTAYKPNEFNIKDRLQPPSIEHPFGTDTFGRDLFTRVIYGSRISLMVAGVVLTAAVMIGMFLGSIAGYLGGGIDETVMRTTDMFFAFPPLILAMVVNAALGPSLSAAIVAVTITWWPSYARMIRGQVMASRNHLYVDAARSLGARDTRIILKHVLPNSFNPTIVQLTLDAGFVILTVAGLSFIGLGPQPPTSELGYMVNEGRQYILSYWWWATFPGIFICLLVVGFNLFGDFLRDLFDPRLSGIDV
jgi:peptide/nickel transport system permease protein